MKKIELLAPAGSFDSLRAAISSGADAVYLGGMRFGARAFAGNFDKQELVEVVSYCHIRGVKIYVTMNTLLYEDELEEAIAMIQFYYENHVDALIIQDLGLFEIIKEFFPDFEIHCSTQMHVHNCDAARFVASQGAKRVVLARETPLSIVQACCKEKAEIEVFVHGALCVCYSGQCLMSSIHGGRSGNRGECAQPCRLQYHLQDTQKYSIDTKARYLLSPCDLYTAEDIGALIGAGVSSIKIEGRMKRAEYVAETVRIYRQAIDDYYQNKKIKIVDQDVQSLKTLFHRGFTRGHLFDQKGLDLVNPVRPNHCGIQLGQVIRKTEKGILIQLIHDLHQNDGIRILNNSSDFGMLARKIVVDGLLTNHAKADQMVLLEAHIDAIIQPGDPVLLTTDSRQIERIQQNIQDVYQRIAVTAHCYGTINQPLTLKLSDGIHTVIATSEQSIQLAEKTPVSTEQIQSLLMKITNTVYVYENLQVQIENGSFISLKAINELRRQAFQLLDEARIEIQRTKNNVVTSSFFNNPCSIPHLVIEVDNLVQANLLNQTDLCFVSSREDVLKQFDKAGQKGIRADEKNTKLTRDLIVISQLGSLIQLEQKQTVIADSSFNVTNSYALRFLLRQGIHGVILSTEIDDSLITKITKEYYKRYNHMPPVGRMIYGRREAMIMKYCVLNTFLGNGEKTNCQLCKIKQYSLISEKRKRFWITSDDHCNSILLEEQAMTANYFQGLTFAVIHFTIESKEEIEKKVKEYEKIYARI